MAKIAAYQLLLYLFLLLSHTSVSISISQSTTHLSNYKLAIGLSDDDFNKLSSEMKHLNLSSNSFLGDVPSSAAIAGVPKLKSLLPVTVFSVLAGVAFISAVAIGWLLIVRHQKRRRYHTVWKMTPFCTLDFSECDVLSNLHEEYVIDSGGSGKVVVVKRLWMTGKSDAKTDKVSVMKLPVYYRAHGEQQPRDRCLHNVNMANHPMFCGWSRVGCICCTAVILFAFYLMALMQLPNLRKLAPSRSSPFAPSPVAVELFHPRKLMMVLQPPPPPSLTGDKQVSVGQRSILGAAGVFISICVLGWLVSWRRNDVMTVLDFSEKTEEHIVHNLVDRNMIGRTVAGEPLYRMLIEDSGGRCRNVIVKKLENENGRELEIRFQSEENTLGMIRHDNIAVLLGSFRRHDMILLVYEDMENGSLDEWLHHHPTEAGDRRRPPLDWPARRSIATDVARGICYMHHECNNPIVHRNINPADIWLDRNLKAKIAGFGVARINVAGLGRPLVNAQHPTGAFGYTAPEYTTMPDQVTEKVDMYSFGVILLELVTGRPANGTGVNGHLATWAQRGHSGDFCIVVDKDMPNRTRYIKEMKAVFKLGVECTAMEPKERPSMETVLRHLSRCGDSWWRRCVCFK